MFFKLSFPGDAQYNSEQCLNCLNSSFISGTWLPPPVPKDRDMPKAKGEVHAKEDAGLKENPGDWCQVPAPVSNLPNTHTTTSYSCMCPNYSEYVFTMMKQVLNICSDDMRMDDDVIGIEEDYFIASEYESCYDEFRRV